MKTRAFTLNGFYYFDLRDLIETSYDVYTDTTTVVIGVEALVKFIKTLKEIYNEIEKNDLENL